MNTKAIIASTLFTAVLAGTSAFAQQDDHRFDFEDLQTTESVVMQKVSFQSAVVATDETVLSSKK